MKRRDFLRFGAAAAGACVSLDRFPYHLYASDTAKRPQDIVTLGRTGIKVSRLAQGTGTNGVNHSSNQIRRMGDQGLADLLVEENWASFEANPDHKGSPFLLLNARGQAALAKITKAAGQNHAQLARQLAGTDIGALHRGLRRLIQALNDRDNRK